MKYSLIVVLRNPADALWICNRRASLRLSGRAAEGEAINKVPSEVVQAAFAAFDARHPGVELLHLCDDTRETNSDGSGDGRHVLRFGNGTAAVVATVTPRNDLLDVTVAVPDDNDLTLSLEQLAPSLRLERRGPMPAVFDGVHRGFVSITGISQRSAAPVWCTEWTRL